VAEKLPVDRDELFEDAARVIVKEQSATTSIIQRKLKLGYNRAGRIIEQLRQAGIVAGNQTTGKYDLLITTQDELDKILLTHEPEVTDNYKPITDTPAVTVNRQPSTVNIPAADKEAYFNTRMAAIGVTPANMHFTAQHLGAPVQRTRFTCTDKGDIRIHYYNLNGFPYQYQRVNNKDTGERTWSQPYYRDRLQVPTTTEVTENGITKIKERKYQSPKGSHNCPYFTPQIIEAYANQTHIPLLVLTEGEFKAVAGCNAGLHVVGITGIQGFYDPDGSKKLHFDILELCRVCKVEKILLLTDADTLQLTYKPDVDLAQRPISFYSSVKNFREAAMQAITNAPELALRDAYYGHITTKHAKTGKGLDDLLQQFAHSTQAVVNSLNALSFNSDFFYIQNITDGLNKISEHFGLTTPLQFYTVYQEYLADNEFKFKKQTYRWIKDEERLHKILHEDIQKFMRIGCDWFKLVMVPNKYGQLDEEIKKWKVGEIQRDYVKNHPTFLDDIPKYEAWCNRPAMYSEYKRIHDGCFNLFNPLKQAPQAGKFEKTVMFLKHLFKGEGNVTFTEDGTPIETGKVGDSFSIALDYYTLQYRNPMQILPVMCLVSPENNTGKTTKRRGWRPSFRGRLFYAINF